MVHRASLHVPRAPAELPLLEACKAIELAGGGGSKAAAASRRARRARRLVAERAVLHAEHERWMHARNRVWRDERVSEAARREAHELFDLIDSDHNGDLSVDELHEALQLCGLRPRRADLVHLMTMIDVDHDGTLDKEEL